MKPGWQWPAAMTGILVITVVANAFVYYAANHDPSFAVEDNYYEKAVDWDAHMAQEARNRALGWRLTTALGAPARDTIPLAVTLTDSAGRPLDGADVRLTAMQIAHAADPLRLTMEPDVTVPGRYAARLASPWAGWWELRFDIVRGSDRFTARLRRETGGT
jgi:nitrogen fixation protein FixH